MTARMHEMCRSCSRPMRRWNERAADYPEGVPYGAYGRCATCDKRIKRGSIIITAPAPAALKRGETIELVRWILTADGYQPELVAGQYVSRHHNTWVLSVNGTPVEYDRDQWAVCAA